jgi:hypothetical protein
MYCLNDISGGSKCPCCYWYDFVFTLLLLLLLLLLIVAIYIRQRWMIDFNVFMGGGSSERKAFCLLPHNPTSVSGFTTGFSFQPFIVSP